MILKSMLVKTMSEWLVERESMLITGKQSFKLVSYELSSVPWALYWRERQREDVKNAVGGSTLCHSPPVWCTVLFQHRH